MVDSEMDLAHLRTKDCFEDFWVEGGRRVVVMVEFGCMAKLPVFLLRELLCYHH